MVSLKQLQDIGKTATHPASLTAGALGLAATLWSVAALAMIEVSGNTIFWPDNGWYQVENRLTGEIVCQGGRECEVADGVYWVSRFYDGGGSSTRIVVGDPVEEALTNATFANTIEIEDTVLRWTVPGWYQVQHAETLRELCNGQSDCDVGGGGQFIVVNHSLGLRTTITIEGTPIVPPPPVTGPYQVEGNRLSWPDTAWYQVENRLTGEIVCQGGTGCIVPDGIYWITRFDDEGSASWRVVIGVVPETELNNTTFADTIDQTGSLLRWTVPGWYQVQNADTLEEICNGEPECNVGSEGRFLVINHSLGLRTTVTVLTDDAPAGGSSDGRIQVNGGVISWPDDGWYQVQRTFDYQTICEGGTSCHVANGSYTVINHTTGMRYDNIEVGSGIDDTAFEDSPDTDALGVSGLPATLIEAARADVLDEVAEQISSLVHLIETQGTVVELVDQEFIEDSNGSLPGGTSTDDLQASFACPLGGHAMIDRRRVRVGLVPGYTLDEFKNLEFLDCQIDQPENDGSATVVTYLLNGFYGNSTDVDQGKRNYYATTRHEFSNLSIEYTLPAETAGYLSDDITTDRNPRVNMTITAQAGTTDIEGFLSFNSASRTVNTTQIRLALLADDGTTRELYNITDGAYSHTERWGEQDRFIPNRLEVSASVTLQTGYDDGFSAMLTTDEPLVRELLQGHDEHNLQSFTGKMTITDAGTSPHEPQDGSIELIAINDDDLPTPGAMIRLVSIDGATRIAPLHLFISALNSASAPELDLPIY